MNTLIITFLFAIASPPESIKIVLNKTDIIDPEETKSIEYPLFIEVKTESPRADVMLKMVNGGQLVFLKEFKSNTTARLPQDFKCEYLVIFIKYKNLSNLIYRFKLSKK